MQTHCAASKNIRLLHVQLEHTPLMFSPSQENDLCHLENQTEEIEEECGMSKRWRILFLILVYSYRFFKSTGAMFDFWWLPYMNKEYPSDNVFMIASAMWGTGTLPFNFLFRKQCFPTHLSLFKVWCMCRVNKRRTKNARSLSQLFARHGCCLPGFVDSLLVS